VKDVEAHEFPGADHLAMKFTLSVDKPAPLTKTVQYRKYKALDMVSFKKDLASSELFTNPQEDVDDLLNQYNSVLTDTINKHVPLVERKITLRPMCPWYTEKLREEKRKRRKLERKWRKSKTSADRLVYREQCDQLNNLITEAKTIISLKW
jgi:23S rRNA G2069 N7-methylase RlmK/C1962 C5-methylase RlmI